MMDILSSSAQVVMVDVGLPGVVMGRCVVCQHCFAPLVLAGERKMRRSMDFLGACRCLLGASKNTSPGHTFRHAIRRFTSPRKYADPTRQIFWKSCGVLQSVQTQKDAKMPNCDGRNDFLLSPLRDLKHTYSLKDLSS